MRPGRYSYDGGTDGVSFDLCAACFERGTPPEGYPEPETPKPENPKLESERTADALWST